MKRISALTILLAALAFPAAAQEYADGIITLRLFTGIVTVS